jgi:hypothetical protein
MGEVELLFKTAPGCKIRQQNVEFLILDAPDRSAKRAHDIVCKWGHIHCILQERAKIQETLGMVSGFILPNGLQHAGQVMNALSSMLTELDACIWDRLQLHDLPRLWPFASQVDKRLFRVEPRLLG